MKDDKKNLYVSIPSRNNTLQGVEISVTVPGTDDIRDNIRKINDKIESLVSLPEPTKQAQLNEILADIVSNQYALLVMTEKALTAMLKPY